MSKAIVKEDVYSVIAEVFGTNPKAFVSICDEDDRLGHDFGANEDSLQLMSQKFQQLYGVNIDVDRADRLCDVTARLQRTQEIMRLQNVSQQPRKGNTKH